MQVSVNQGSCDQCLLNMLALRERRCEIIKYQLLDRQIHAQVLDLEPVEPQLESRNLFH